MSMISNKPRILRGAFVEYGLSLPPLFVAFQFNPEQLTRSRSLSHSVPGEVHINQENKYEYVSLRNYHKRYSSLSELKKAQLVDVQEENINLEIRFDAFEQLNEGDSITQEFGIAPQLATLEEMVYPKGEGLKIPAVGSLLGSSEGHSNTKQEKPPMILFIWGRKRVLPVNIQSLNITEVLYSPDLNPLRATATVSLTVIEGPNTPYQYSKAMKEAMSVLNLANISDIANVIIPG